MALCDGSSAKRARSGDASEMPNKPPQKPPKKPIEQGTHQPDTNSPAEDGTPQLFRFHGRYIGKFDPTNNPYGYWELNPEVLNMPSWDSDPNSGKGLALDELERLLEALELIRKKLKGEIKKRGGGRKTLQIHSTAFAFLVAGMKEGFAGMTDPEKAEAWEQVKAQAWKQIWPRPEMKKYRSKGKAKNRIRDAVNKLLKKGEDTLFPNIKNQGGSK